jgi:hypothetical protein
MPRIPPSWIVVAAFLAVTAETAVAQTARGASPEVCDDVVRRHEKLQGLLALVAKLKDAAPLWDGYRPSAADYVFLVPGPDGQRCAVPGRDGLS